MNLVYVGPHWPSICNGVAECPPLVRLADGLCPVSDCVTADSRRAGPSSLSSPAGTLTPCGPESVLSCGSESGGLTPLATSPDGDATGGFESGGFLSGRGPAVLQPDHLRSRPAPTSPAPLHPQHKNTGGWGCRPPVFIQSDPENIRKP